MKKRILLSAAIGAMFAGALYPVTDLGARFIATAVAFFVLLGIFFCTLPTSLQDKTHRQAEGTTPPPEDPTTH